MVTIRVARRPRRAIARALFAVAALAATSAAAAHGFAPCDAVGSEPGVVRMSWAPGWFEGPHYPVSLVIRRTGAGSELRARVTDWAKEEPLLERRVALSADVAVALEAAIDDAIARADPALATLYFDPPATYNYEAAARCVYNETPLPRTPEARLAAAFRALATQAFAPGPLQPYVERLALAHLDTYAEKPLMADESFLVLAALFVIVAFAALPFVLAGAVAALPRPVPRGRAFVLASGALAYGTTCAVALFGMLPIALAMVWWSARTEPDGGTALFVLQSLHAWGPSFLGATLLYLSVRWPLYLRRGPWTRLA